MRRPACKPGGDSPARQGRSCAAFQRVTAREHFSVDFNYFLTSYLPTKEFGGERLYSDMIDQALLAERLGFRSVSIPEHHLVNVLLVPSPLQMAVKIASMTNRIEITTAIVVLPVRDMRIFAGEVVQADILCNGRLVLGVGRGAFAYEVERLGTPIAETRKKFDESFDVLCALLSREEVSWDGEYYRFEPITIMPRPARPIPMMVAAMAPEAIYAAASRGLSVQTTPLQESNSVLLEQVDAFKRGKAAAGKKGKNSRLSLQRVAYAARDDADAKRCVALIHEYYKRFDNVFSGPGIVNKGLIEPLPRKQTVEELERNVLVCPPAEMVDRLGAYEEAGIDEVILSGGFGQSQADMLEMMHRFASEVAPHFSKSNLNAVA
ncbi:LLM class flavin-dependent oxidoreductase [Shinella sp. M27]|uniref:LLM class flavin-dependent oxidoreductase n=1 Tax=Shinella sp. M27 TaxID=3368614 RepID=UPI003BA0005E